MHDTRDTQRNKTQYLTSEGVQIIEKGNINITSEAKYKRARGKGQHLMSVRSEKGGSAFN